MDFEDFFEKKNRHHNNPNNDSYRKSTYSTSRSNFNLLGLINSIKNNRKLKILILGIIIIVVGIIIGIIALLYPLIIKSINYISENGISGVYELVMNFLNKLWNGTK